jgi:hypothetical protein
VKLTEPPRESRRLVGLSYSGLYGRCFKLPVVVCLSFSGRDIAERFHQPMVIELGHPFQRCQLDGLACFPGATMNQFSLVQADDRFSEGIVVTVAPTADRRFDARFGDRSL